MADPLLTLPSPRNDEPAFGSSRTVAVASPRVVFGGRCPTVDQSFTDDGLDQSDGLDGRRPGRRTRACAQISISLRSQTRPIPSVARGSGKSLCFFIS